MKMRLISGLLIVALLIAVVPVISAQGGEDVCFNLPEEDCAVLMQAIANSDTVTSEAFDINFDATIGGIGAVAMMMGETGAPMEDITVNMNGSGALMEVAGQVPPMVFDMSAEAGFFDGTEEMGGTFDVKVVDGMVYFAVDGEWAGAAFEELMEADPAIADMLGGGEELPTEALSPDELSGLLGEFGIDEANVTALMDVPGFVNAVRDADTEFAGQTMQVYTTTIDFAPLFASSEFSTFMSGMSNALMESDPESAQMMMMVPMFLTGLELSVSQSYWVGADDMYIHGMLVNVDAAFDLAMLMGGGDMEMPPITLDANMGITFDQIGETFEVVAPDSYEALSPEDIQELSGMLSSVAGGF